MGLLKHLLFWPYTGPKFLFDFSMEKVHDVVREELTDDSVIKAELMELHIRLELGEIDDDEYLAGEAVLMRRLREIRQWREEFGMGVAGGPVRVQAQDEPEPDEAAPGSDGPPVADASAGADIELNLDWD
jgi:hypothetical protein